MSAAAFVPTLLQEVNLTPQPASPNAILHVDASPSHNSLFGAGRKRAYDEISTYDEETYSRKHLASEASVFFRGRERSPRTILWRVLDNRQILEIQSVDLIQTRQQAQDESTLTFRIGLPAAIIPGGVVLADSHVHDALEVFALTTNNDLFCITLRRDLLIKHSTPKNFDPATCITKHHITSLSFRRPYKVALVSSIELLISLHDGGLLRLEREGTSHHAVWKEIFYAEGGWTGTLRGLIPIKRHQTVRFGELELEPAAATSMAKSPDGQLIWTVTLEHELVAWSIISGKVVARRDLMGARQDPDDKRPQYIMPAEQGRLLQIAHHERPPPNTPSAQLVAKEPYQLIVYSPKDRAFKLFRVPTIVATSEERPRPQDILEGEKLILPFDDLLNTNLWRCTDFRCKAAADWSTLQLWVQIQSGVATKLFTITLNLLHETGLSSDWQQRWRNDWTVVAEADAREYANFPMSTPSDSNTPSKKWLAFLLYPGRFSTSALATALHLYRQKRKLPSATSRSLQADQRSFEERLTTSVTTGVHMRNIQDRPDYEAYYADVQAQWAGFYSILQDLQSKRLEMRSFALDEENDLAWIIRADSVAPVQATDVIERLRLNADLILSEDQFDRLDDALKALIIKDDEWDDMTLLVATQSFAEALPQAFRQHLSVNAVAEATKIEDSQDDDDAQAFFDSLDVGQHVTDEAYQNLELALHPLNGIGGLTNGVVTSLVKLLSDPGQRGSKSDYTLNRYGSKLMTISAQHLVQQNKRILLALLALVAFINKDFEEDALDPEFDAHQLFVDIMSALKHAELRDWLTRTVCLEPSHDQVILSTVFESLFIGDWDAHTRKTLTPAERLSHWSRQWAFAKFNDWHGFTSNIFSTLLRHDMIDLAAQFTIFLRTTPWTHYLRGRLYLALGTVDEAALEFQAAARGLSERIKGEIDTAGLLNAEEVSHFGEGQQLYNLHIANLFEKQRFFASTADFAKHALSFIDEARLDRDIETIDRNKASEQSPHDKVANARAEVGVLKNRTVWEEIVSRLFNALIQTGRFADAYSALQKFKTPELQRSNVQKLIESCSKNDMLEVVLELPFDAHVVETADAVLLKLAKKSMTTGTEMLPEQQVLYAFRTRRGDYRGAAQVLHEHLERLKHHGRRTLHDPEDETLLHAYLILINTLACCGDGEEWLLSDPIEGVHPVGRRRKLIRLEDVRRDYVAELDKRSDLQHGRFPLVGDDDDEMDVL